MVASRFMNVASIVLSSWTLTACMSLSSKTLPPDTQLVESRPIELAYSKNGNFLSTYDAWMGIIEQSRESLDFCQQYININDDSEETQRILSALEQAGRRGVKIRFLLGTHLQKRNVTDVIESIQKIRTFPNVEIRESSQWESKKGIVHAKYIISDSRLSYIGSANFDWKVFNHIAEVGIKINDRRLSGQLKDLFDHDWAHYQKDSPSFPLGESFGKKLSWDETKDQMSIMRLAVSPYQKGMSRTQWDLNLMLDLIAKAHSSLDVTAMNYHTNRRHADLDFLHIQKALIAAKRRGVAVRVMLDEKSKDEALMPLVQAGIFVQKIKIPEYSGGPISYARLLHTKFINADGFHFWIGNSNFGPSYFERTRNVSFFASSINLGRQLTDIFDGYWNSGLGRVLENKALARRRFDTQAL